MTNEQKKWIDNASYEELLERWRFAPVGVSNPLFQGDTGDYYSAVMKEKGRQRPRRRKREKGEKPYPFKQTCDGSHVATSKAIGWGN